MYYDYANRPLEPLCYINGSDKLADFNIQAYNMSWVNFGHFHVPIQKDEPIKELGCVYWTAKILI